MMDRLTTLLQISGPRIAEADDAASGYLVLNLSRQELGWQVVKPDSDGVVSLAVCFQHKRAPLALALPDQLRVSWREDQQLQGLALALVSEAEQQRCGGGTIRQHLAEILLIRLLREAIEHHMVAEGVLAGLANPQIAKALVALHDHPEMGWTVERLADQAAMSRTTFIEYFSRLVGEPPGTYLKHWKLMTAQRRLEQGSSVAQAARMAGYSGPTALTRAYQRHFGYSPITDKLSARAAF